MKLLPTPLTQPWMSDEEKSFRENANDIIKMIPNHSFLDASTFKIEGHFDNGVRSVVCKVSDVTGSYVVKMQNDTITIPIEVMCYRRWLAHGVPVIHVEEMILPNEEIPYPVSIMQYINEPRLSELVNETDDNISLAYKLGGILSKMHNVTGIGYGVLQDPTRLIGQYQSFNEELETLFGDGVVQGISEYQLLKDSQAGVFSNAKSIMIRSVEEPTLIHHSLGLHSIFNTKPVTVFDPKGRLSHPMFDLAMTIIWTYWLGSDFVDAVVNTYKHTKQVDNEVLQAALFLELSRKYWQWYPRSKHEKKVVTWIDSTLDLFHELAVQLS